MTTSVNRISQSFAVERFPPAAPFAEVQDLRPILPLREAGERSGAGSSSRTMRELRGAMRAYERGGEGESVGVETEMERKDEGGKG